MAKPVPRLTAAEIARVIEIAWNERPPFHALLLSHGLTGGQVVQLLKRELSPNAYKLWLSRSHARPGPAATGRRGGRPAASK